MGVNGNNKQTNSFDLAALLDLWKSDIMASVNCHALATIESFNESNQTVQCTINYKKTLNGAAKDYPTVIDCPIIILTGGTARLTFPISQGDTCLLLFNDRNIDSWFETGQVGELPTQRSHSFSDAIALVGLRSMQNVISDYDTTRARLQNGAAYVGVSTTKIKVANGGTTLNTLLQDLITKLQTLCTDIEAITVICAAPASPSSVPVNAAAFAALSTQIATLGTQIGGLLE